MVSRSLTALRTVSVSDPPCRISGRAYERQSLPPFEVFDYVAEDCKFKSQNVTIQNAVWPAKLKNFLCPPNSLWVHFFHQGKLKAVKYALHIKGLAFPELWLPKNNPELGDIIVKVVPYCSSCQIRHLARCAFISLRRLWAKHIPRICRTAMPTATDATGIKFFWNHLSPAIIQPSVYIMLGRSKSFAGFLIS